jgi:hypothetical protein
MKKNMTKHDDLGVRGEGRKAEKELVLPQVVVNTD